MTPNAVFPWDQRPIQSNALPEPDRVDDQGEKHPGRSSGGLHVGRPNIGDIEDFIKRVRDIFDRRWFTNGGPLVLEFEEALCRFLGVRHCIPVCNATVGLSLLAHEFAGGDYSATTAPTTASPSEVILPSFTFIASPHSLRWKNITPVFCDIDPKTHNLDPAKVESLISPRTKAILGVHIWGRPCCVEDLQQIASRHRLPLYFDAAHAFACSYQGTMLGNFGNAEVFSFHATKFFNTFEGGAIATNDDDLAKRLRLAINFGFAGIDSVQSLGTNAKMNEISAAMGLNSLPCLSEFIQRNYENFLVYQKEFSGIPGLRLEHYPAKESMNFQYIVARVETEESGFSRDELYHFLKSREIYARRYFYPPCHQMEPYRSELQYQISLPYTEALSDQILCFPNGTSVEAKDIRFIASCIRDFQKSRGRQ